MGNVTVEHSFIGNAEMQKRFKLHVRMLERVAFIQETHGAKVVVDVKGHGNRDSFDVYVSVESTNKNLEQTLDKNLEMFSGNFS